MFELPAFAPKPLRWIVLTLDFSKNPLIEPDREIEKLEVKFAPISDCEEFLVLGNLYDHSVRQRFRVGQKCAGLFDDSGEMKWFKGTILEDTKKERAANL